jgi:cell division protein FtsN
MTTGNMLTTGNIVMIAIFAFLVVVGLAVSLITITLRNIRETNGQVPQWPVSWPELPESVSRQRESLPRSTEDVPQEQTGVSQPPESVSQQRESLSRSAEDVPQEQTGVSQPPESVPQQRESLSRSPESVPHGGWGRRSRG